MRPFSDYTLEELEGEFVKLGQPKFRARQAVKWYYEKLATGFDRMTDLPRDLRAKLPEHFLFDATVVAKRYESRDGTIKLLVGLTDGERIETVMIPEEDRRTVCLSTQAGCPVGCVFCASGIGGLKRNLSAGEIVEQLVHVRRAGVRMTNVVLMGIGEPLLNYPNTARALRIMNAPWGLGIGWNRITLSTVGLLDKVRQLVKDGLTPNLAMSLHAPSDELRRDLIPTMKKYTVNEIIEAAVDYKQATGKDVTFEYVLLSGVNDDRRHAMELGRRIGGKGVKVNVIPFNPVPEFSFQAPSRSRIDTFVKTLGAYKVFVSVRRRRGDDISAACGQLRRQESLVRSGS